MVGMPEKCFRSVSRGQLFREEKIQEIQVSIKMDGGQWLHVLVKRKISGLR